MWLEEVLTLIVLGNNQGVNMASNISLYLESSFSNMLFLPKGLFKIYRSSKFWYMYHETNTINSKTCKEKFLVYVSLNYFSSWK